MSPFGDTPQCCLFESGEPNSTLAAEAASRLITAGLTASFFRSLSGDGVFFSTRFGIPFASIEPGRLSSMNDHTHPEPIGLLPWVVFLACLIGVLAGLLQLSVAGYLNLAP